MLFFTCTKDEFRPLPVEDVRWLDKIRDYELAREYWAVVGQTLKRTTWTKAHEFGYEYAAVVEDRKILSIAGIWRFSEVAWELAAVSTRPGFRRHGYSKRVCSFLTASILQAGRLVTCSTADDTLAMIATVQRIGFKVIPPDEVWWSYPELPDF